AFGRATVVENEAFTEGCASSYRTGLDAVDERAKAVVVLLGDQPGVDRAVIDLAVEEWRRAASPIMLVSYRGRLGHPLIFARSLFGPLAALRGGQAAWELGAAPPRWVR